MTPGCSHAFTHRLRMAAVYWAKPDEDGLGGRIFQGGAGIGSFWIQKQQVYHNATGDEIVSTAMVLVGQDMDIGGYLWLGEVASLTAPQRSNPLLLADARKIEGFEKTPTIEGGRFVRVAYL